MPDILILKQGAKVGPGRFILIQELGRGGMGVVWLAQDTNLDEQGAAQAGGFWHRGSGQRFDEPGIRAEDQRYIGLHESAEVDREAALSGR